MIKIAKMRMRQKEDTEKDAVSSITNNTGLGATPDYIWPTQNSKSTKSPFISVRVTHYLFMKAMNKP